MKYIMLHGLGQSSESWSDTVKVFNDDFEVLCPNLSDLLSGKTPCYDTLYRTLETYCEQFEAGALRAAWFRTANAPAPAEQQISTPAAMTVT